MYLSSLMPSFTCGKPCKQKEAQHTVDIRRVSYLRPWLVVHIYDCYDWGLPTYWMAQSLGYFFLNKWEIWIMKRLVDDHSFTN